MSAAIRMHRNTELTQWHHPEDGSSEVGEVELALPRDRNGSFIPQLVPKGSRRLGGLDEMIISLYAGGMTLRDI